MFASLKRPTSPHNQQAQKSPAAGEQSAATPGYLQEKSEPEKVATKSSKEAQSTVPKTTEQLIENQRGGGHALPEKARQEMEQKFNSNFEETRVHTGDKANKAADQLNARAFTVGRDVFFAEGEYAPDTTAGKQLLAHELTHVVQQQEGRVNRDEIKRDFIRDAAGTVTAYEFRPGTELTPAFIALAKGLGRDGGISDDDLRSLRRRALLQRGTLNDHERMFMAGLMDPANVATLSATNAGDSFQFPTASITRARRDHVNNLDRELPPEVQTEIEDLQQAWDAGDAMGVMNELGEIEAASQRAIVQNAGSFRAQAESLLAFIQANNITASETLQAMIQGASDNSRGDRVMAGIVYAILQHAGHGYARRLANGEIKVDALTPSALAALPGFTGREQAAYVTTAQGGGAKGDTMYVKTDMDITNLYQRSVVVHEAQHASDDAASSPVTQPTFPIKVQLEANAYRAQARYLYSQMAGQTPAAQAVSAGEIARAMNAAVVLALVREGQTNSAVNKPLFRLINNAVRGVRFSNAQIDALFAASSAAVEARLLVVIGNIYGLAPADQGVVDGLAGESALDWVFRI